MIRLSKIFLLLFATIILANSCKENSTLDSLNSNTNASQLISFAESDLAYDYNFYINQAQVDLYLISNSEVYSQTGMMFHTAYAYLPFAANNISLNNHNISPTHLNSGSYSNFTQDLFKLNGDISTLAIQGNSKVPSFNLQIRNPQGFAKILSPSLGQKINSKDDLTITWESVANDNMDVKISLISKKSDPSNSVVTSKEFMTKDNGSFTIPSDELVNFKKV
jgi:hypothetical protein